ncbi:hypothetical protein ROHU_001758 [Labeo rohita]|uniref:Chromo domain-containing protein n=1 Tax=Labeo rohita TaxID=84645 RepID=A0A498P0N9_LABRO|nr:hypothetical protein ROHU_001758 [Labeo rohita]
MEIMDKFLIGSQRSPDSQTLCAGVYVLRFQEGGDHFSDASTLAIAAVAYLRVVTVDGQCHVGFIMAKSKLAPYPAHTVPRLELCAAVLAVELAELITEELDLNLTAVKFYTDRKKVHVFGNSPSPAVAIFGIRRAADLGEEEYGREAKQFVHRNFYVDDGLISVSSAAEAIGLLQKTKNMLAESNIKLHKISSNNHQVMEAFPTSDRANDLKDLDLSVDPLPLQRSLGVSWSLETDCFVFQVSPDGKALVRELSSDQLDWDTSLPMEKEAQWKSWTNSLSDLREVQIHRPYVPVSMSSASKREESEAFVPSIQALKDCRHAWKKVLSPVAVQLRLLVFYVSCIKPVICLSSYPSPPHPPVLVEGSPAYKVKKLLAVCPQGGGFQHLVDWEGYGLEERSWIPDRDILVRSLIEDFFCSCQSSASGAPGGTPRGRGTVTSQV